LGGGLRVVDEDAVVSAVEHVVPCVVNVNTLRLVRVDRVFYRDVVPVEGVGSQTDESVKSLRELAEKLASKRLLLVRRATTETLIAFETVLMEMP